MAILLLTAVGVTAFGRTPENIVTMSLLAGIAGFFANAGISGLYSIAAVAFPTHVRATGTGVVIGLGRFGGVLAPMLGGLLIESGAGLPAIALIMGMGSLFAALALLLLRLPGTPRQDGKDRERQSAPLESAL